MERHGSFIQYQRLYYETNVDYLGLFSSKENKDFLKKLTRRVLPCSHVGQAAGVNCLEWDLKQKLPGLCSAQPALYAPSDVVLQAQCPFRTVLALAAWTLPDTDLGSVNLVNTLNEYT